MLTDENMVLEKPHTLGGTQRIYRFKNGHGLSAVNAPMLHSYPFAWEIAVSKFIGEGNDAFELDYSTLLTTGVEVFDTDDEANAFIAKAKELFDQ